MISSSGITSKKSGEKPDSLRFPRQNIKSSIFLVALMIGMAALLVLPEIRPTKKAEALDNSTTSSTLGSTELLAAVLPNAESTPFLWVIPTVVVSVGFGAVFIWHRKHFNDNIQ